MSTGFACDQIGGSAEIELLHGSGRNAGKSAAKIDEAVHGQDSDPSAIREDRQPLAQKWSHPPERLGGGKQFVEVEHSQQPGAAKRRFVDRIGTGERAGMRLRRLGALRMAPRLDHDDRLDPSGGARRRHELARIVDGLHVQEESHGSSPSSAKKSSRSPRSTSIMSPSETTAEKPIPCAADHSIRPAVMAPDCDTRARSPVGGMRAAKLALSLARDDNTPRQLGPTSLRPVARAAFSQPSAKRAGSVPETGGDDDRGRRTFFAGRTSQCREPTAAAPRSRARSGAVRQLTGWS